MTTTVRINAHRKIDAMFALGGTARAFTLANEFRGEELDRNWLRRAIADRKVKGLYTRTRHDGVEILSASVHSNCWYEMELPQPNQDSDETVEQVDAERFVEDFERHGPEAVDMENRPSPEADTDADPVFGEVIYEYTATQAVEDGFLVDGRELEGEAGEMFRDQYRSSPVYLTRALYGLIQKAVDNPRWCNDLAGVCWDIIWMARGAISAAAREAKAQGAGAADFRVTITGTGRARNHVLTAGLDGNGLTFSLRGEN